MNIEVGTGAAQQVIPDEIQVLFGKPPLLHNESAALYRRLLSKIAIAIDPQDIIEWFWVKDITDLSWEIQRVRRFKATMINYGRKAGLAQLLAIAVADGEYAPESAYDRGEELALQFIAGNAKAKNEAAVLLEKNSFDEESIMARAFHHHIEKIEIADRMLATAELRRDKVLREIEFRREAVGRRMREIVAAESNKAFRLPGPKVGNDEQVLDELPPSPAAKVA